jgi:oligopeptide transport system permease protein
MTGFILRRLLQAVLVLWAIATVTFFLMRAAPGGPFDSERAVSAVVQEQQRKALGLDQPLIVQYGKMLGGLLKGDPGPCERYEGWQVNEIIAQGLPISLRLGLSALSMAVLLGLPLGMLAAARQNDLADHGAMALATLGICLPTFITGPLLALTLGIKFGWFRVAGWYTSTDWVLPSLTLGFFYTATLARLTRSAFLEILSQDFIRTARAKGASPLAVMWRHGLRSALSPVVAYLGPAMAGLVTGSFVVENVFQIPGLGQHFVAAAQNRDIPLACATGILYGGLLVGANLLVDIIQAWLNPRIRLAS